MEVYPLCLYMLTKFGSDRTTPSGNMASQKLTCLALLPFFFPVSVDGCPLSRPRAFRNNGLLYVVCIYMGLLQIVTELFFWFITYGGAGPPLKVQNIAKNSKNSNFWDFFIKVQRNRATDISNERSMRAASFGTTFIWIGSTFAELW